MDFQTIVKQVDNVYIKLNWFKIWVEKPMSTNNGGIVQLGLHNPISNQITVWRSLNNDYKLSILIHELIHAADWFGFNYFSRWRIVLDIIRYPTQTHSIRVCREEMIAYLGQAILSQWIGLPSSCQQYAVGNYKIYKNKLEKAVGKKCSREELIFLKDRSLKRIEIVNEYYYNFLE